MIGPATEKTRSTTKVVGGGVEKVLKASPQRGCHCPHNKICAYNFCCAAIVTILILIFEAVCSAPAEKFPEFLMLLTGSARLLPLLSPPDAPTPA